MKYCSVGCVTDMHRLRAGSKLDVEVVGREGRRIRKGCCKGEG
jgi:hypothetical protein